jgi:hypothetical protein
MDGTITKKNALLRMKLKLALIIRMEVRPTCTTKNFEKSVIRHLFKETLKRSFHISDTTRKPFYEKLVYRKSITPEAIWCRDMCQKC